MVIALSKKIAFWMLHQFMQYTAQYSELLYRCIEEEKLRALVELSKGQIPQDLYEYI